LPIPKDAAIGSMSLDGDRIALHFHSAEGTEIVVLDLATGKIVSRVRLKPQ
jgi:hypothetical protein